MGRLTPLERVLAWAMGVVFVLWCGSCAWTWSAVRRLVE